MDLGGGTRRIILSSPSVYGMYVHMYEGGLRSKSLVLFFFFPFFLSPFFPRRYVKISIAPFKFGNFLPDSTVQVGDGYGWSMGKSKKQTKPFPPFLLFPKNGEKRSKYVSWMGEYTNDNTPLHYRSNVYDMLRSKPFWAVFPSHVPIAAKLCFPKSCGPCIAKKKASPLPQRGKKVAGQQKELI